MTDHNDQSQPPAIRIGHGYDIHRLATPADGGRPLIIGGVRFEHDKGPVAHSDGDALLHAVTDAILGALALPDIGERFPNTSKENEGRDSEHFIADAVRTAHEHGYAVSNLDCTVILEKPPLKPLKNLVKNNLIRLTGARRDCVNVKGKTHEGLDSLGENRAIEAHAVVILTRKTVSPHPDPGQ